MPQVEIQVVVMASTRDKIQDVIDEYNRLLNANATPATISLGAFAGALLDAAIEKGALRDN